MTEEDRTALSLAADFLDSATRRVTFMGKPPFELLAACGGDNYAARCLALQYHAWNEHVKTHELPGMCEQELFAIPESMMFHFLSARCKALSGKKKESDK